METGPPCLVTGAGGFVGSAVIRVLRARSQPARLFFGPTDTATPPLGWDFVVGDITDRAALEAATAGIHTVIHLAGPPSVTASFEHPAEYARVHVVGSALLVELCRIAGVQRIVHVSSADVYAASDVDRVAEDHPLGPRSPYAACKLAAEIVVQSIASSVGLEVTVLRPFSVYGPGVRPESVIGTIIEQAKAGGDVTVADSRPVRDYVFIEDVAGAIVTAAFGSRPSAPHVYNIGTGRGTSVGELAKLVGILVGGKCGPVKEASRSDRPATAMVLRLVANPDHAAIGLGWKAGTTLEAGLARTLRGSEEG